MEVLDWIIKLLGALGGLIGTVLGIYNYVHSRRKEGREGKEKKSLRIEQEEEWKLYASLTEASKEGLLLHPSTGSVEHKRAERLVERGMLQRFPGGYYGIPGQQIKIGIE
jgi:hypothetical protein